MIPAVLPPPAAPVETRSSAPTQDRGSFDSALRQARTNTRSHADVSGPPPRADHDVASDDAPDDAEPTTSDASLLGLLAAAAGASASVDAGDGTALSGGDGDLTTAGVDRTGVGRAGVDRAGVDPAGVDLTGVDLAGVDRAGVDLAGVDQGEPGLVGPSVGEQALTDPGLTDPGAVDQTGAVAGHSGEASVTDPAGNGPVAGGPFEVDLSEADDAADVAPDAAWTDTATADATDAADGAAGSTDADQPGHGDDPARGGAGLADRPAGGTSRGPTETTPESGMEAVGDARLDEAPEARVADAPDVAATARVVDGGTASASATTTATGVGQAGPVQATTSVDATPLPAPSTPAPPVHEQLVQSVTPLLEGPDGIHEMTLELRPAELGRVVIEIQLEDGRVSMHVRADEAISRKLLDDALPELRTALERSGVRAGDLDVRHGGGQAADRDAPGHADRNGNRPSGRGREATGPATGAGPNRSTTSDAALDVLL